MSNWLSNLRTKPKRVKDQYAFASAFVLTGVIASIWFVSLESHPLTLETEATSTPSTSALRTFFSDAREQLASLIMNRPDVATSSAASTEVIATTTASTTRNVVLPELAASSTFPRVGTPIIIGTSSPAASSTE